MSRAALKSIQAASGGGPAADTGDEYWGNTVLLLDGEGTDGGQNNTFTDSSSNSYTITDNGDVSQGSFSPYLSNWSNYFGNADSNVTFTPSFTMGTNDFCIEFWANFTETPASSIVIFFSLSVNTGDYLRFELNNAGQGLTFRIRKNNANDVLLSQYTDGSNYDTPKVWTHFAVTRSSNTFRFFVDGVLRESATFSGSLSAFTLGSIGCWTQIANDFKGYISNLRITNGSIPSSRQTSSTTSGDEIFTPPTSNLDAVTDTVLLTCRSNRFIDLSSSPHTLSTSASPIITTFSPTKDSDAIDITTDGGSAYFGNGAGTPTDYLSISDATGFDIGSSDFTFECWVYLQSINNLFAMFFGGVSANYYLGYHEASGKGLTVYTGDTNSDVYSGDDGRFNLYEWNHVVFQRSSNNLAMYLNGTRVYLAGYTYTFGGTAITGLTIGRSNSYNDYGVSGYIADARMANGTALYGSNPSNITVPTAPLTAISNTDLLLNFQDSNIYDLTGSSNIETIYQASVDTSVKKYGTGSIQMDGAGDYLEVKPAEGDILDFNGDFTIEFWLYTTSTNTQYMFDSRVSGNSTGWSAFLLSNLMYFNVNGTLYTSGTLSNYTNTWIHVAFVRSGSVGKWYIDGTASGSNHSLGTSTIVGNAGKVRIGAASSASTATTGNILNGYMDDFRITNGIARYTSNFTPSSEALPKF